MQNSSRTIARIVLLSTLTLACAKKDAGTGQDSGTTAATTAASFDKSAEAAAIQSQNKRWERGVATGNVDSVMAVYSDDAISMGDQTPAATGRAAVRETYTNFLKAKPADIKLTGVEASFSDDGTLAYDRGSFTATVTGADGKPAKIAGDYIAVWKKEGGEWKIAAEASNSTIPRM